MLDVSRSMAEPAKFDLARRIAAALCYIGLVHLDRLTILPFGARARTGVGARARQGPHLPRLRVARAARGRRPDRPARVVQGVRGAPAPARADGRHLRLPRSRAASSRDSRSCGRSGTTCSSCTSPPSAIAIRARSATCGSSTPRPASCATSRSRRGSPRRTSGPGTRTPTELERFCGRYDIGYVRADAERPFEDIVLKAFRQGRFLA